MGRGRQKAKQTKVARELKYFSPVTDYDALQRELRSNSDPYAAYADDEVDETEEETDEETDEVEGSADDGEDDDYENWVSGSGR